MSCLRRREPFENFELRIKNFEFEFGFEKVFIGCYRFYLDVPRRCGVGHMGGEQ